MKRIRTHLSYANVAATLAVLFAMSGGAIAATGGFSSGGTLRGCVNEEGGLKLLKAGGHCRRGLKSVAWNVTGPAGRAGANGAAGGAGAAGAAGAQGKEGPTGKEGKTGEAGSAVGYAVVAANGTLNTARSKGVVSVNRIGPGIYCFALSFTPKTAVASAAHISSNFKVFAESAASKPDVEAFTSACPAPNDDASVLTLDGTTLVDDAFYVSFE